MSEKTSMEQAGGVAVGLTGTICGWNADSEACLCKALDWTGKYVEHESGCLLGHIKAAIVTEDGKGMTLNLTNMETGIEHHGVLEPQEKVKFSFMAAVLDVDEHELKHMMYHAIDDTGLDYQLDENAGCSCGCHDHHDHEHHHEHGEECHCHDHGHEHSHEHTHEHVHDHHHDDECHCHDHHHEEEEAESLVDKQPGVHYYFHHIHEYHHYYHMEDLEELHELLHEHGHHH